MKRDKIWKFGLESLFSLPRSYTCRPYDDSFEMEKKCLLWGFALPTATFSYPPALSERHLIALTLAVP